MFVRWINKPCFRKFSFLCFLKTFTINMLSVPGLKHCVVMQFDSQNTWNKHILFFFFSLKIRNFENYCPSAVSRFRSGRRTQWILLPKLSNNFSFWMMAGDCLSRKEVPVFLFEYYLFAVFPQTWFSVDQRNQWQFRVGSQNWLSTKQCLGVRENTHRFSPFLSLRDYF